MVQDKLNQQIQKIQKLIDKENEFMATMEKINQAPEHYNDPITLDNIKDKVKDR